MDDLGCLGVVIVAVFVTVLIADGMQLSEGGAWGVGVIIVPLFLCLYFKVLWAIDEAKQEEEKRQEALRKVEAERRWNSPEEVGRRREAERLRAKRVEEAERERKRKMEEGARRIWNEYHKHTRIDEIDAMTGKEFEKFVQSLLQKMGYQNVQLTAESGDQGADLLCDAPKVMKSPGIETDRFFKCAVQTKRWSKNVGNSAVQEVLGAMLFYACDIGIIITSSHFTDSAKALVKRSKKVELYDREWLAGGLARYCSREVPEFNWDYYNKHVSSQFR